MALHKDLKDGFCQSRARARNGLHCRDEFSATCGFSFKGEQNRACPFLT